MEFCDVVQRARHLHSKDSQESASLSQSTDQRDSCSGDEVFGRICNTSRASMPAKLSESAGRKTVFIFGPDSIQSIILRQNTYDCLLSLGFDHEYIRHEVVETCSQYWLVLFPQSALPTNTIQPATWEGVLETVKTLYPEAYSDTLVHIDEMRTKHVSDFESEAGLKFLDAKRNITGADPSLPMFHDYPHFLSLPRPRKAWQVRLFLYCELRLLQLFCGDGHTHCEDGGRGPKEYLCPNLTLDTLDQTRLAVIPMSVTMP